jgi:hypothetical protein
MNEYESEPVRGLPEHLPAGEEIVWQGAPAWRQLAVRAFHVRKVAVYFVLLAALHVGLQVADGAPLPGAVQGASWLLILGVAAVALLGLLAWLYGRTTLYTITNERLVMRFGVAIPMMINIPWEKIDAADLSRHRGDAGDIELTLAKGEKIAYWLLWPHAKPWHFTPVRPMLRCLDDAQEAAQCLSRVVAKQQTAVVTPVRTAPVGPRGKLAADPRAHTTAMSQG